MAAAAPRRWLAPEVVQTSAMDCGPASLSCLLEGFRVRASYGRIREACQTEVDGTSIDTLEDILVDLGFDAEQIVLPVEHVLLRAPSSLPAIAVIRLPNGYTHFIVVWRTFGPFVQIMDPATGRRWQRRRALIDSLYRHTMDVPAEAWREWAGSDGYASAMAVRLGALGVPQTASLAWLETASADASSRGFAALDAATRMTEALTAAGGIAKGRAATRLVGALFERARRPDGEASIPARFWAARASGSEPEAVTIKGAILVKLTGRRAGSTTDALSPELVAALEEVPERPWRRLLSLVVSAGRAAPASVAAIVALTSALTLVEALVLRGVLDVGRELGVARERWVAWAALAAFFVLVLIIEAGSLGALQTLGRRIESHLRLAFLSKVPRLGLRYFRSRPSSDMAERVHNVHRLRALPDLVAEMLRSGSALFVTTLGILLVDPRGFVPALLAATASIAIPLVSRAALSERELKLRTHAGALFHFYLDAQVGLVPLRTHGAARALRSEHEQVLTQWLRAGKSLLELSVLSDALSALTSMAFAAWVLLDYVFEAAQAKNVLLVAYWALSLGGLGQRFALSIRQYPPLRNVTLRLLEPLGAPDEIPRAVRGEEVKGASTAPRGAASLAFEGVTVRAGGHTILEDVALTVAAGEHVAIVGSSGAGKSSLLGLLLGLHRASEGVVRVDGDVLDGPGLDRLRPALAWVDPSVRLWNTSLLANVLYGTGSETGSPIGPIVSAAELASVLDQLPDGMQSTLGEGGALVSGGEGQRVRLARALARSAVRLALLDEPFRGLDIERRRALLTKARAWWADATLLCVTHDVGDTVGFARVLVVEGGRIVEDGSPETLAKTAGSRYAALLEADRALRTELWAGDTWKRLRTTPEGSVTRS